MNNTIAALDIGSNSVNLLIVEMGHDGVPRPLFDGIRIPRLSEGLQSTGRLSAVAMDRTLAAIAELLGESGITTEIPLRAVITAPGRRASNGRDLIDRLHRDLNLDVRIASASEEAELSRLATRRSFPELPGFLMADVGGASTELALCRGDDVEADISIDQGAVRISEAYLHETDPPSTAAIDRATEACRQSLAPVASTFARAGVAGVFVGGTATTLASVHAGLTTYDAEIVHHSELMLADVRAFTARVEGLTLAEKRRLPSIHPARADVILGGALLIQAIFELLRLDRAFISDRGVRWGTMWQLTTELSEKD